MLSIVIPTLNEEKYLPILLNSLKSQSFVDYEIIVSDGASDDRTIEVAKNNNCKIVISEKNKRHPSIQRNLGVTVAQGDILLFLDADTSIPDKFFLEKTLEDFNSRELGSASYYINTKSKSFFYKSCYFFYNKLAYLCQYLRPLAIGAGIIVKKKLHEKIGGFDESIFIGEDHDYCFKTSKIEKFRLIKTTKIYFSTRRFETEGRFNLLTKLIYSAFYVLIFGPIRKKIVQYDFGKHKTFLLF
jgi:glycosyltransferase involved in cell wall biosynthesis